MEKQKISTDIRSRYISLGYVVYWLNISKNKAYAKNLYVNTLMIREIPGKQEGKK